MDPQWNDFLVLLMMLLFQVERKDSKFFSALGFLMIRSGMSSCRIWQTRFDYSLHFFYFEKS